MCTLNFTPGMTGIPAPGREELTQRLEKAGCSAESLVPIDKIQEAIESAVKESRPLNDFVLSRGVDGTAEVEINASSTKALLFLRKGVGKGKQLSFKDIGEVLKASRLPGMDIQRIKQEIQRFMAGTGREIRNQIY